jgi:uncharacterized damage-inducible protein DinB
MTECSRLADQIRRAFDGEAWHGDALVEVLSNVSAAQAAARPIKNAHTIWEIVLHIAAWDRAVLRRIGGTAVNLSDSENFPAILDTGELAWETAVEQTRGVHSDLVKAVAAFPDSRLPEQVLGKEKQPYYDYFYMFAGIAQHETYHTGQIVLLKKM